MAIAKGKESAEATAVKRYMGVASCYVFGVNLSKSELEKVYNTTLEKDMEYISKTEEGIATARIDFIVKSDKEKHEEFISKVTFFLRNEGEFNKDKTKVKVIDKFGRTCWCTIEQAKAHEIPEYSNGPANIDKDYRPCFRNEEQLTQFIKTYLNIPNVMVYKDGAWIANPDVKAEDCECRLDSISEYFKGNFSELKDICKLQPNNKLKILFGVKVSDDNKMYQACYTDMFLKNNSTDYSRLEQNMTARKAAGAYPNISFEICDAKEFELTPTPVDTAPDNSSDADDELLWH